MKKQKLIMMCFALLLGWSSARAQSWTSGATVAAGDFYIYNLGTGKYLNKGVAYGTHSDVDGAGAVITISGTANNYLLHFAGITNDKYFGSGGYVDRLSSDDDYTAWSFESVSVDGYTNVYRLKANKTNAYLYWVNSTGNEWCNET